jgi:hypothetical protein
MKENRRRKNPEQREGYHSKPEITWEVYVGNGKRQRHLTLVTTTVKVNAMKIVEEYLATGKLPPDTAIVEWK